MFIDIEPRSFEGAPAGGTYRVVAGDVNYWDFSNNGAYQYFGVHSWNALTGSWENYAWLIVGHVDTFLYSSGAIVCQTTAQACTVHASVAPAGSWPSHLHTEFYNYYGYSRSYEWDGPSNANDQTDSPLCSRTSNQQYPTDCNTQMTSNDRIGYVGGNQPSFAELNNPYYPDF